MDIARQTTNLHSVMEAANALSSLVDEDSNDSRSNGNEQDFGGASSDGNDLQKRYLPDHKKPDAALTFPEKLMAMMRYAEQQGDGFCVSWLNDGKSFIIRDADTFTKQVVPKFFKATKFSSFTRKLYRWGFRQINRGIGQDDPIIFGSEHFQRKAPELMSKMRSTTAAATRKQEEMSSGVSMGLAGMKRPAEVAQIELQQQLLLRQLLSKKANVGPMQQQDMCMGSGLYGNGMAPSPVGCNIQSPHNNMSNPMSLSHMLHPGNQGSGNYSGNYNFGSGGVSAPQHQQLAKPCNNLFVQQQQQMMQQQQQQMMQQQQQQQMMQQQHNDALLGNLMTQDRSSGPQFMPQDIMDQFMSQDKMGNQFMSQDKMGNQFMPQDKMGNQFMSQDKMGNQFMPQDKMGNQFMSQGQSDSSLLGQFNPVRWQNGSFLQPPSGMLQDFPNATTTAEIVNAAIQALKYS